MCPVCWISGFIAALFGGSFIAVANHPISWILSIILISDVKDIAKAHVACIGNDKVGGRRLIVGKEVKKLVELSLLMAEAMPEYAKKLPKKELPNFMVKLISYLDSSAKTMIPDLGILMQTDTTYAEELLGFKFKTAKGCISENAKSVVRLGLV